MAKKDIEIKVGMLVSYDYSYVRDSLPLVYQYTDSIYLAIDKNRKTWNGEIFDIPESFFKWIETIDTEKKISIYEDNFYIPELTSIECDVRERNMLAQFMGLDGWHIFIDTDEYFLKFNEFVKYLKSLDYSKPTQVYAKLITLFQKDESGFFLTDTNETYPVATNNPFYIGCRLSEKSEYFYYSDFKVLHQSWAREDDEIKIKLRNWGHNTDFDTNAYYSFWKAINKQTYKYVRSFHPLDPWLWPSLEYFEAKDIKELIEKINRYLLEKEHTNIQKERIKLKDFIPPVLYKIKTKLKR